ncbi:MAG: pur operon repressor [Bacillus thermozeamaize]|jgi:purine operon repressor|uniref:Pur operon repressor n=1 Tax=Bacillus thermozeamaize TaxID=230954 RepID=A0A1Y3PGK7_9BACI|nr:MAG: pur operon repressor [Bacillus thermozeamaize]
MNEKGNVVVKRSSRLVDMTYQLALRPNQLVPLGYFSERYRTAKSSISEDLAIMKEVLEGQGHGRLQTITGAAGGVRFEPAMGETEARQLIDMVCRELSDPDRLLPGGYLYMSDLLGDPAFIFALGRLFATVFARQKSEVVMTIEMKGIPLAYSLAYCLHLPVVVVRRDQHIGEGSFVSINYVSGSRRHVQTMSLARRSLSEGSRVLIVDDFMKAGGTLNGMLELLKEFGAEPAGIGVFVESAITDSRLVKDYVSIARLVDVDEQAGRVRVVPGNILDFFR